MNDRLNRRPDAAMPQPRAGQKREKVAHLTKLVAGTLALLLLLTGFVTAQNTYEIHDGEQVLRVVTYSNQVEEAYARAGISVQSTDQVITEQLGGIIRILIERARPVTISVDGVQQNTLAYDQTVAQVLAQQQIAVGEHDLVSPGLQTEAEAGMTISVTRRSVTTVETTFLIPYETQRIATMDLPYGTEVLTQSGANGTGISALQTITYTNGTVEQWQLPDAVATAAVPEIISVGTKVPEVELNSLSVTTNAIVAIEDKAEGGVLTLADGSTLNFTQLISAKATAYYAGSCGKSKSHPAYGITATGTQARVGAIAVDPKMIPYGTKMFIVTADGTVVYGYATAEDCGGSIKGNRIDLYFDTAKECFSFGRRNVDIYILEPQT